jgi:hypothetical protein
MSSETSDLEIAKKMLRDEGFSLVIVKSGAVIHATREYGVIGLIKAIERHGAELNGSAVADKVAGKAAVMLCRYAKVAEVYAEVISEQGLKMLNEAGIRFEYRELVPKILNRERSDLCPFEKLVANCSNDEECYEKIKDYLKTSIS